MPVYHNRLISAIVIPNLDGSQVFYLHLEEPRARKTLYLKTNWLLFAWHFTLAAYNELYQHTEALDGDDCDKNQADAIEQYTYEKDVECSTEAFLSAL